MGSYDYKWTQGKLTLPEKRLELANFYSEHYGRYSDDIEDGRRGRSISLSSTKINKWLDNDFSDLYTVRDGDILIGYAIVERGVTSKKEERIIWVTQLVVHTKYRNNGIGKELLFSIWCLSPYYAWGLLTANPYAIRALEKATHRRCDPTRIKKDIRKLMNFGEKYVWYINKDTERQIDGINSKINTDFPVDLSEIEEMLARISDESRPWKLGMINVGWEWFAFTFNDQNAIELSKEEIEKMLEASDSIVQEAYARMPMDNTDHKWAKYTGIEIDFIVKECKLVTTDRIIDIGCGMGRHSIELASRGYDSVIGVDLVKNLIEEANKKAIEKNVVVKFTEGNIYKKDVVEFHNEYDCVLCLYDVIGSYASFEKNVRMLENIVSLLKTGGYLVMSVMNLHYTEHIAKNRFRLSDSTKELLALPSSKTMEETGNVFNPDYFLIDTDTKVVYRKEEFSPGNSIPKELIVRDRRFYKDEIEKMCSDFGLEICLTKFVSAGWDKDRAMTNGKEILLVCRKK